MEQGKCYNELANEIMECAWDIQDVIDGTNNDFSKNDKLALNRLKKQCEFFLQVYSEYQNNNK